MKKFIMLPLLFGQSLWAQTYPGHFKVDGRFRDPGVEGIVTLQFLKPNSTRYLDSAVVVNGSFHIEGEVEEPVEAWVSLEVKAKDGKPAGYDPERRYRILLEPVACTLTMNNKMADAKVEGSRNQMEYDTYYCTVNQLHRQMQPLNMKLYEVEKKFDVESYLSIRKQLDELLEKERQLVERCVNANPASPVALFAVSVFDRFYTTPLPFKPYFDKLDTSFKYTAAWKKMAKKIHDFSTFLPGDQAVDFSLPDTSGNMVALSAFKGKYVFLDFWASWCGPCRAQSPFIKRAFEKFRDKPFQIVAVAEDREREKWIDAMHEDGVGLWTQLLDRYGKPDAVGARYNISSIPQNLLIDPAGKIVARNLSGLQLEMKLKEILN